jgi:Fe(3+) dicitrate transport protein
MNFNFMFGVLLAAATSSAMSAPLLVSGIVVDQSGAAVPDARVVLRRDAIGFEGRALTDGSGNFALEAPSEGDYDLSASRDGFSVTRLRIELTRAATPLRLTLNPGVFSEEITVIATRVAGGVETLQRIPGSVEVIGPDQLAASRVFTACELLRKASGVNVRDEEGLGLRPNIGLRGLNPTRSGKLLLLEDGLPLAFAPYGDNATYYHPPVERFESIELLKGSAQISYGPVTVGGVVNYITPGPPLSPEARLRLAGGNRAFASAHAQAGGTWGRTGLRLDYLHKRGDGARNNVHSSLNDLNLKAVIAGTNGDSLTLKGNFYGEDSQVTYSGLREEEYARDPRQNPFANDAFTGRRFGASAKHTLLLAREALLTTHLYGSLFSRDWWRQSSNSGQRPNDAADPACGGMANLNTTCGNEGRLRDYGHLGLEPRLRLGHRLFGAASEAEIGLRAHLERQQRRQENGDTPTARSGRLVEDNRRGNAAYSAFAQNRLLLGRLTLTPGIRVEHIRYKRTNRLANGGLGVDGRTSLAQWVPGVGAALTVGGGSSLFAGVHRGFAPPRTEDVIDNTTGGAVDLDPERSWNYELGLRARPRSGVSLDATLFRMAYQNQIVPASLAGGVGAALTNGGATLHQGIELGARVDTGTLLDTSHDVFLRAAFTAMPVARFEGFRFSNVPGFSRVSVSGNRLPYAPERLLTASLGYRHPRGLTIQFEAVHVSEQFGDDLNTRAPSADGQRGLIPGHTVWNATLNHELRRPDASFYVTVKNLLDRSYIVDRARGILPGSPRLLQLGVSARF